MLPPRKWLWSLGLLAAAPVAAMAGPLDFLKPKTETPQAASAEFNHKVAQDIAEALRNARLVGKDIDIEFIGGVARLKGQIADEAQRARATQIVSQVPGVKSVENQLTLMSGAPRKMPNSPVQQAGFNPQGQQGVQQVDYTPSADPFGRTQPQLDSSSAADNQIVAQQIAEAVTATGLQNYELEIRFKDGQCTLIGSVDNQSQAIAANEAAASVPGVKSVVNRLTVGGRPVSVADQQAGRGPQQMAQFQPYPNPQAAQMVYAGQQGMASRGPQAAGQPPVRMVSAENGEAGPGYPPGYPYGPGAYPPGYAPQSHMHPGAHPPIGPHQVYNSPNVPDNAWPAYAPYPNYAAVSYPSQYDASAFPYIGPFYPYPQVPLGWRKAELVWDDGYWNLKFDSKTDRWWWFLKPDNWH